MAQPIVLLGGWLSSPKDYVGMARTLAAPPYNRIVYITDFTRIEWAKVRDPDFTPVLNVLARTVELALQETGAERIDLIGHSAGGRVARAYLGHLPYNGITYDGQRHVASLTTLGTAHTTYEVWVKGFGALINERYPGAFYEHIRYTSVAGRSVLGRRFFGNGEQMLAFRSYETSFGDGRQMGDGIIPTHCCYLEGADNLMLEGARHAPYNAPRTWYGAPAVIPLWFESVAEPLPA
ncbi:esterase/lipase family protein [Candidatus Viridilinea mediisalina]|uniref:Lipase n=1 Tax=Candidatus Viridilinea mediisalina TaxID=2024553 RepID=A0A2A6RMI3_9CHLR|nr:alpha/beta fold hydrolase [Candidatus Viridilinea mediisalina]PDW04111.1 lipase [Candidatus Viridilinea mediisalina]